MRSVDETVELIREKVDILTEKPERARGVVARSEADYIQEKHGKEGTNKVEEVLEKLGHSFSYDEVSTYQWYSEGLLVSGLLAAYTLFEWDEEDVFELGKEAPYFSIIIKTVLQFSSVERTLKTASVIWDRHYDFGEFDVYDYDIEAGEAHARLYGYDFPSIMHEYFNGYLATVMELATGEEITMKHQPCKDEEDCHEFHAEW